MAKKYTRRNKGNKRKQLTSNILPQLRKVDPNTKKYHYKLDDSDFKRHRALNDGVQYEFKKFSRKNNTIIKRKRLSKKQLCKKAATAKKGRLNILRIYRRNNNKQHCNIITSDMKYLDHKYKLGNTTNIC